MLRRLRVGVVLDSTTGIERWQLRVLEDILSTDELDLLLIVAAVADGPATYARPRLGILFSLYRRVDRALFDRFAPREDPFTRVDIGDRFPDTTPLYIVPTALDGERSLDEASTTALGAAMLDVIVDFGSIPLATQGVQAAPYGVWRYQHGEDCSLQAAAPYFHELFSGSTVTTSALLARDGAKPGRRVVCSGVWRTYPLSLHVNHSRGVSKAVTFVGDSLRRLHCWGAEEHTRWPQEPPTPVAAHSGGEGSPGTATMLRFLARMIARIGRRAYSTFLYDEQWLIGVKATQPGCDPWTTKFEAAEHLSPPAGHVYADPFLWRFGGTTYLFFEECPFANGKGVISYVRLDERGRPSPAERVLEDSCHLSYPSLFEHEGDIYMIPESVANRKVELYRAEQFPTRWVRAAVLLEDIDAVDATLFEHGGRFWLFVGCFQPGFAEADELRAFWSLSPFGPWVPHDRNPLHRDIRRSRPAGAVLRQGGELILPVQDGARRYGHRIAFLRIDALTPSRWEWTELGWLDPGWMAGNQATHTFNRNEHFEVVDAQVLVPKWRRRLRAPGQPRQ